MAKIHGFQDIDVHLAPEGGFIIIGQFDPILDQYALVKVPVSHWRVMFDMGLHELGSGLE